MTLARWDNNGRVMYDKAIGGIPFLDGTRGNGFNDPQAYRRETSDYKKQQIDQTPIAGEQRLQSFWYRSQDSWHLGAGIDFFNPVIEQSHINRFQDSCGVNVFTAGKASLLHKADVVNSASGDSFAVGYSIGGEDGVLHAYGTNLLKVKSDGTTVAITITGNTQPIWSICTDGGAYYVLTANGVFRGVLPSSTAVKIYNAPTGTLYRGKIAYVKQQLLIAYNSTLYIGVTRPSSYPIAIPATTPFPYQHQEDNWTWTGMVDAPGNMFFSGYSGDQSLIYSVTFDPNTNAFTYPASIAELPRGEIVLSISLYLGTYLIIGTNTGVRVGIVTSNGTLVMGPLSVNSNDSVGALLCYGNYVWTGGSKATKADASTKVGLYRLDLTRQIGTDTLLFPWQRDIYSESTAWSSTKDAQIVQSVTNIGYSGRVAYTIKGIGLIFEDATNFVVNGYLDTGRIRMDTGEAKIFQSIKVDNLSVLGHIKVSWRDENETSTDLYNWDTQTYKSVDTLGSDGQPHNYVTYRFTLSYYTENSTVTPFLVGYTVRSLPSNVVQRTIISTLLYMRSETDANGVITNTHDDGLTQLRALEALEKIGAVVLYQDFGIGEEENVIIDNMVFLSNTENESRKEKASPSGILTITMKTVG